jgi:hypothetical protein
MQIRRVQADREVRRAAQHDNDPERLARRDTSALKAVINIAERWDLTHAQLSKLLGAPERTVFTWKAAAAGPGLGSPLARDTVERMSYVLGIWKALVILFADETVRQHWLNAPNTAGTFGGQPPLARILAGNVGDLYAVRTYLDGVRG